LNILILAQHYAPEEISGAVLATELAEDLVNRGHQVTIVTPAPNYPDGVVFSGYRNTLYDSETLNGVRVIRTWTHITPSKAFWQRLLHVGIFSITSLLGGLVGGRIDVIMSYSPPLPLGISALLLSRLRRVPWVLRVEDLYPEAAIAAGILHGRSAIRILERLERFIYREADHISLISEGFHRNLIKKRVPEGKLSVAPVWADPDLIRPKPKENNFRKSQCLEKSFVVMYAGTMGYTSALEDVLEAAYILRENPLIKFALIGEGVKKDTLIHFCRERDLTNIIFLPFQQRDRYAEMLASADVSLVTLNKASSRFSMPGKVFSIMASQRPILAVTPPDSEVAEMVETWKCGVNVPVGQPEALAEMIIKLSKKADYLDELGSNGRQALLMHRSRQHCVSIFEEMLKQVTE
jgi:glycosyltransferase involved in cell wall biosynthesis